MQQIPSRAYFPWRTTLALITTMVMEALFLSNSQAEEKLTLRVGAYIRAPYYYLDDNQQLTGLYYESLKCVLDKMNVNFSVQLVPWARAQRLVENGILDVHHGVKSNKRDAYAHFSVAYIASHLSFHLLKQAPFDTLDQLKARGITAARLGTNKSRWLKSNDYNLTTLPESIEHGVVLLDKQRIDGFLEENAPFQHIVKTSGRQLSDYKSISVRDQHIGFYFGKQFIQDHPGFLAEFNQFTESCRR